MLSSVEHQDNKMFGNVMIIGLGMIGGSFAKALKERGLATLFGVDRKEGELALGVSTGVIDYPAELTEEYVSKMDVIIIATPVRAMEAVLSAIKPLLNKNTLMTDVGSTKGSVVESARRAFGYIPANFIPGHPIAGAEKSGVLAANSQLFEKHMAIVTPLPDSDPILLDKLHRLWSSVGADVVSMDVEHHDHVLASSSHLPHLLAYTLVDSLANSDRSQDIFKFAAGGFRDFTRIASSDPVMWRDVFMANKEATLATLDQFTDRLSDMRTAIEQGDGASMFGVFTRAKSARDHFLRLLEQRTIGSVREVRSVSVTVSPASSIKGTVSLLGDRFLSHKAITIASLSEGVSVLANVNLTGDVRVTLQVFRDMGVVIEELSFNQLRVHGVGLRGLKAPIAPINVHQSRTSLYLLLPVIAGQSFPATVIAEGELLNENISDLISLVCEMGVKVESDSATCLPVCLFPANINNISIDLVEKPSGVLQMSALLAALFSPEVAYIKSVSSSFSNNELLLRYFSADISQTDDEVRVFPKILVGKNITLPGSSSKAVWLSLLATLLPGSKLVVDNVAFSMKFCSFMEVLKSVGSGLVLTSKDSFLAEGSVEIGFSELRSFILEPDQCFELKDELLLLCVAAAYAKGESCLKGIDLLPYYYEDRVLLLVDAFSKVGVVCSYNSGVLKILGGSPSGGELDSAGDDQVALAMLALSARSNVFSKVNDCQKLLEEFNELESISEQLGFHCSVVQ